MNGGTVPRADSILALAASRASSADALIGKISANAAPIKIDLVLIAIFPFLNPRHASTCLSTHLSIRILGASAIPWFENYAAMAKNGDRDPRV